ncbi:MAG: hypothetical protein IJP86_11610 [Synergistaceae bacterium]|nr:hypothetical protein [Synergistaceae bacterium]
MSDNTKPLRWHKFLVYFSLWAGAVMLVLSGAAFIAGTVYGEMGDRVYQAFPVMRSVDIVYGLVLIGVAVYVIYTRFQLAGFRQGAPQKLLVLLALSPVLEWGYQFVLSAITGVPITEIHSGGSFIGELIGTAIGIWLHKIYYGKRKELFVN